MRGAVRWTRLRSGKYSGMSLPELLVTDPNHLFWLIESKRLKGDLLEEAKVLKWRARHIRIPKKEGKKWAVEYVRGRKGLAYLQLVPRAHLKKPPRRDPERPAERSKFLDLSVARRYNSYDLEGARKLLCMLRELHFDEHTSIRPEEAERFFGDERNFAVRNPPIPTPDSAADGSRLSGGEIRLAGSGSARRAPSTETIAHR